MEENVTPQATPPSWRAGDGGGAGDEGAGDDGASGSGGGEPTDDDEQQQFDISLPATHSYMGNSLVCVRGRAVLEAGWQGSVLALAHHGAVFPGETVPMNITDEHNSLVLARAIHSGDRLFALLSPDESGALVSGYGALCEVFESSEREATDDVQSGLAVKARAVNRIRFVKMPPPNTYMQSFTRMTEVEVRVLPEVGGTRRGARLHSLDPHRRRNVGAAQYVPCVPRAARVGATSDRCGVCRLEVRLRRLDALLTPWPQFVYDAFDCARMRDVITEYFATINLGSASKVPEEAVALSYWVAANLPMAACDRLALLALDDAAERLHLELRIIQQSGALSCACGERLARRDRVLSMSCDGAHSNYTNVAGFLHSVVTVSEVEPRSTTQSGRASTQYSWFPGYAWTIALCAGCSAHIGWRFDALKKSLRPQQFYALCRNYVQPRAALAPRPAPAAPDRRPS